ncbi:MAG TPA: phosphatase PAP2 family protein [Steroidobacteraceae bacterium]|nr:phosphatase PAP2 family protein [Steroidobacteraceae bacterium]
MGAAAAACVLLLALAPGARADSTTRPDTTRPDDTMSVSGALEDVKLYFTAPVRWDEADWLAFAGSLAAIGISHSFDARVRSRFATGADALNGGEDKNSLRDAAPTAAIVGGTALYAWYLDDRDGYRETWALLEAGVLSTVTAEALGYAAGRERPDASASPNQWGKGGDSFPSVHVAAAFAVGTTFAESGNEEYRWLRRILGYGIAAGTAYVRLHENVHWLSDTVAGSALGIATARFAVHREAGESRVSLQVEPAKGGGWMLSCSMRTH